MQYILRSVNGSEFTSCTRDLFRAFCALLLACLVRKVENAECTDKERCSEGRAVEDPCDTSCNDGSDGCQNEISDGDAEIND